MTDETPAPTNRIAASLIAAIPFVALQLAFLCDPYGLSMVMFGYGAIVVFAIGVFVAWLVYLGIEVWWRAKRHCTRGMPVFAGVGGVFLLLFFAPSMFLRPALLEIPTFCRATQAINWKTSTGEFILVLSGTGTTNNYRFTNGYMNWIGDGRAGFSSVHVNPIEFQYDYYEPHHSGSLSLLRRRMAASQLPDAELNTVSELVWDVLEQANRGDVISSPTATIDPVWSGVDDMWDAILGGWIWIFLLTVTFIVVGRFSLVTFSSPQAAA